MSPLRERLLRAIQDERVAALLRNPRVQSALMRALKLRGRLEGEVDRRLARVATRLNLATQKDVRALQRRIRHLEDELRDAQARLSDPGAP
jgi:polyhydroxyalkanoate synthesis regulator phasin